MKGEIGEKKGDKGGKVRERGSQRYGEKSGKGEMRGKNWDSREEAEICGKKRKWAEIR